MIKQNSKNIICQPNEKNIHITNNRKDCETTYWYQIYPLYNDDESKKFYRGEMNIPTSGLDLPINILGLFLLNN